MVSTKVKKGPVAHRFNLTDVRYEIKKLIYGSFISSTQLFVYETCTHPIISNEMCGVCGEDLKSQ